MTLKNGDSDGYLLRAAGNSASHGQTLEGNILYAARRVLEKLYAEGRIRAIGVSNAEISRVPESYANAVESFPFL